MCSVISVELDQQLHELENMEGFMNIFGTTGSNGLFGQFAPTKVSFSSEVACGLRPVTR